MPFGIPLAVTDVAFALNGISVPWYLRPIEHSTTSPPLSLNASSGLASLGFTVHRICAVFATVFLPLFTFLVNVTTYVPAFVIVPTIVWPLCFRYLPVFFFAFLYPYVSDAANVRPFGNPVTFATLPPTAATSVVRSQSISSYA